MSAKIKDGLFMGDIDAAQDIDFLQLNGIQHIINCVPRDVENLYFDEHGSSAFTYINCDIESLVKQESAFFALNNQDFMHGVIQVINCALEKTESVLVHSLNGVSRSPCVILAYLMVTYCWGVDKAFAYLLTKKPDIKPDNIYIQQLRLLEKQLSDEYPEIACHEQLHNWNPSSFLRHHRHSDELVLVHTFMNATAENAVINHNTIKCLAQRTRSHASRKKRVTWIDHHSLLKKMHPILQSKPERPPNISYRNMIPGDGWTDNCLLHKRVVINDAPSAAGKKDKAIKGHPFSSYNQKVHVERQFNAADVINFEDSTLGIYNSSRSQNQVKIDSTQIYGRNSFQPKIDGRSNIIQGNDVDIPKENEQSKNDTTNLTNGIKSSKLPRYQQETEASINAKSLRKHRLASAATKPTSNRSILNVGNHPTKRNNTKSKPLAPRNPTSTTNENTTTEAFKNKLLISKNSETATTATNSINTSTEGGSSKNACVNLKRYGSNSLPESHALALQSAVYLKMDDFGISPLCSNSAKLVEARIVALSNSASVPAQSCRVNAAIGAANKPNVNQIQNPHLNGKQTRKLQYRCIDPNLLVKSDVTKRRFSCSDASICNNIDSALNQLSRATTSKIAFSHPVKPMRAHWK